MERQQDSLTFLRALPLLWLSLAFLAGIPVASLIRAPLWLWLLLAGMPVAALIGLRKGLSWLPQFALAVGCLLFLGAARYEAALPQIGLHDLAYYNDTGSWVKIRGQLEKPPIPKDGYLELLVRAEDVTFFNGSSQPADGLLLARTQYDVDWHYGERLSLSGELVTPAEYEDFSYRDYLARQGVYSLMQFAVAERLESAQGNPFWTALYSLRESGLDTLYRLYPSREAALLAGILLGDESGLSDKVKTAFNDTGTRHIIAISGFNISIIAGLFLAAFSRWLGARKGAWLAGIGVALYTLLVGADASVVRAAIMGILTLIALQTGRQSFALNTLGFSAALMALFNPLVLWDVGFQLSFAATLGLVLYAEPLHLWAQKWLEAHLHSDRAKQISGPVKDYLLLTIAAQITTLPILLYYFQRLSLFSLPANVLILPIQPAVMVLGGLSVILGSIFVPLGQLVAFGGWALAAYTIRIVEFFAELPWASQSFSSFSLTLVFVYFAALAALSISGIRQRLKAIRIQPAVGVALLATLSLWIWSTALAAPNGKLQLTHLEVDGEALLVRTPAGRNLLINTGSSSNQLMDELSREMPFGQKLDWILMAGGRYDQIGAIRGALERLSPKAIAWAMNNRANERIESILDQASELGIPATELHPGDNFELGRGAQLRVLSLGQRGAVLLLRWNNFEMLLPLGMDFDQMEDLNFGKGLGPIDLLTLADSGYPPLNPAEWIANLNPSLVWLTAGDELFSEQTLDQLGEIPVFRTDQNGWLRVSTDGEHLWLNVARK